MCPFRSTVFDLEFVRSESHLKHHVGAVITLSRFEYTIHTHITKDKSNCRPVAKTSASSERRDSSLFNTRHPRARLAHVARVFKGVLGKKQGRFHFQPVSRKVQRNPWLQHETFFCWKLRPSHT